ncbi:MAG: hypothetical protein ACREX8_06035 [Gammaproteobacteria bacterium]
MNSRPNEILINCLERVGLGNPATVRHSVPLELSARIRALL